MPRKQIVLDPNNLIKCPQNLAFHCRVNGIHIHDCRNDDVHNVAEKSVHVNVLNSKIRTLLSVLEAGLSGMHYADVIEVFPEWASSREI
jgi:hypothetical protein